MTTTTVSDAVAQRFVELAALEHLITVVVGEACGEDFHAVDLSNGFDLLPGGMRPGYLDAFKEAVPSELDGTGDPVIERREVSELLFTARVLASLTPEILMAESSRLVKLAEQTIARCSNDG